MKIFAIAVLLTVVFSCPWSSAATIRDVRNDCGSLARTMASSNNATTNPTWLDDLGRANFIEGYIWGFVDASPDIDRSKAGDAVGGVCHYIEEHPELWKLERPNGIRLVVGKLYK